MNDELKKKKTTDIRKYQAKYMQRHKTLCITLDKSEDADIIRWLESCGSGKRSKAVKSLIRGYIKDITPTHGVCP